ncbi:protein of unknown function [Magnetospirillum sp. XM-1]|nr:hypothetical protein [Magnetospirillum sp. XM-1]CUW40178.1 protein of unknown function [Magnetospirillum sp. XM-1]
MRYLMTAMLLCLSLAACGNCEIKGNNDRTRGGCSVFNTGF